MDDHFITFDGKIKCLHCQCVWKSLSSTTKRAHLSNREFSLQYQVAGCDESISQIDTAFKESNNEFFRELQRKKMKSRTLSVKRDRFTSFSPSAKSNVSSISSNSSFDDELEIMEEVTVKRQTNLYEYTNPQQAHNTDIAMANFFIDVGFHTNVLKHLLFML